MTSDDNRFMAFAITLAKRGLGQTANNPSVGAVIVQTGAPPVIVGQGWTQPSGRPHAETVAINQAGDLAKGATLYVTLEPCSHHGKTPPCVDAIIESGITRVVIALKDPNPLVLGRGIQKLQDAGIDITFADKTWQREANWLTRGHVLNILAQRPFIQVKMAVDSKGHIAPGKNKAPVWVTGPMARNLGHKLRAQADAILIGRGTVEEDNPTLTCRLPGLKNRSPIRIVLDSQLSTPNDAILFRDVDQIPLWLACSEAVAHSKILQKRKAGAEVMPLSTSSRTEFLSIKHLLSSLPKRLTRLMIEGGPKVIRSFWEEGCVDEIIVFQNPSLICLDGISAIHGLELESILQSENVTCVSKRQVGGDIMSCYRCHEYDFKV